jgi:hypothetical protein
MIRNSFLIKGSSITLVSALFALVGKDVNLNYVLITYIVIPIFWVLDGFCISIERQYKVLYNVIRDLDLDSTNFNMNASVLNK